MPGMPVLIYCGGWKYVSALGVKQHKVPTSSTRKLKVEVGHQPDDI